LEVSSTTNDYSYPTTGTQREPVKTLDKDAFLQLFIAQLRNQDPSSPQDTSQFIAQMALFSVLEQLTNMNEEIAQLRLSQEMSEASALIGRQVTISSEGEEVSGQVEKVTLAGDVVQVYVDGTGYGLDQVTEVQ
jgi:flagellar basal-body rod modification protein FlgD